MNDPEAQSIQYRRILDHPLHKKATGHSVKAEAARKARHLKRAKDFSRIKTLRLVSKIDNKNIPEDVEKQIQTILIEHAGKRHKKTKAKKTNAKKRKKTVKR